MQRNIIETMVGAVVLIIAFGFVYFAYSATRIASGGGYPLEATFERVDGLTVGSDVRISGIKVGSVDRVDLDTKTFEAKVRFALQNAVQVPDDSEAAITADGLLGGKYVNLIPGGSDASIKPGGRISRTQAPIDLVGMLGKFVFSAGAGKSDAGKGDAGKGDAGKGDAGKAGTGQPGAGGSSAQAGAKP